MDIQHSEYSDYETKLPNAKLIVAFVYLHLMIIMFLVEVVRAAAYLNLCSSASKGCSALGNFIYKNIKEEGVNKKTVRFFDTLGNFDKHILKSGWNYFFIFHLFGNLVIDRLHFCSDRNDSRVHVVVCRPVRCELLTWRSCQRRLWCCEIIPTLNRASHDDFEKGVRILATLFFMESLLTI